MSLNTKKKKKKKKGSLPQSKEWIGKLKPLEENGKSNPSKYVHGKSFATDQGCSKLEVDETFDFIATQMSSKEVFLVSQGSQPYH